MHVHVDDFMRCGTSANLRKGCASTTNVTDTGEPTPGNLYLGCKHEANGVLVNSGVKTPKVVYIIGEHVRTIVEHTRSVAMRPRERDTVSLRKWRT